MQTQFCRLHRNKSVLHTNQTSIRGWNPRRVCPGNVFCLCVCIMQLVVSRPIKELKCWVSVSLLLLHLLLLLLSLVSFFLILLWHRATGAYFVTLTDTKQDSALRQDRRGPGCPISVSRLLLLSGVSLAFFRAASVSCSVTLWSESGWCEEETERQTEIWQLHMWCFPLEAASCTEQCVTLLRTRTCF